MLKSVFAFIILGLLQLFVEYLTYPLFYQICKEQTNLVDRERRSKKAANYTYKGLFYLCISVWEWKMCWDNQWLPKYFIGGFFYPEKAPIQFEAHDPCLFTDSSMRFYY